jgi:putative hydrolase of the HAD superfamily
MLAYWHGKKRLAVVSNFYLAGYPERYLSRFGLGGHFEFVLDSAAFGQRKPSPRIFRQALQLAGCAPSDACFVGDRLDLDFEPASALGMRALLLDRSAERPGATRVSARVPSIRSWDEFR